MNVRLGFAGVVPVMPPPPPPEEFVLRERKYLRPGPLLSIGSSKRAPFVNLYQEAMSFFERRDWAGAEVALKNLVRLEPRSDSYLLLGYTFFYRNDFQRASIYFDRAAKRDPTNSAAYLSLALAYNRQGKPQKAVSPVLKTVALFEGSADARFLLGYLRHRLGQWVEAEESYRYAIRLRHDFAEAYQYLAVLYFEMGAQEQGKRKQRFRKAIQTYWEMIKVCPNAVEAFVSIGFIHDQLGEVDEAAGAYRKAIETTPDDMVSIAELGTELLGTKRYAEAKSVFQRTLEMIGDATILEGVDRAQILTWLGVASMGLYAMREAQLGDEELLREAEQNFLDALIADPNYVHAQINLGGAYYEQGRLDDAIKAFQRVQELDPQNTSARKNLGALLEEKLEHRLLDLGLLKEVKKPIKDFTPYTNRIPITVKGKPLSETLLEDRR